MNVTPRRAAAFAPGHVTGLFEIHDESQDLARRGSRGAGFCLAQGAISYVEVEPADEMDVRIALDKEEQDAPVTRDAVIRLLKEAVGDARVPLNRDAPQGSRARIRVRVHTELQLPVSQGFGMSAAGALSATLALARCLRMGRSTALLAAHAADASQRSGLGDVVGAAHGGFEIRTAPGVPPYGTTRSFVGYGDAVLCVVDGPLETRRILSDPERRSTVNAAGARAMGTLLASPSLDVFLEASQRFAQESGLLTPAIERAVDACSPYGRASMSMLGHSVFAFGNAPKLAAALKPFGTVYTVPVSAAGARLLELA